MILHLTCFDPTCAEILVLVPPYLLYPLLSPVQPVLAAQPAAAQYDTDISKFLVKIKIYIYWRYNFQDLNSYTG